MILDWFNARDVAQVGTALADQFAPPPPALSPATTGTSSSTGDQAKALGEILQRVDREVRTLRLNFYKKAKFANSFKWRLLENGVQKEKADQITQMLVLRLSESQADLEPDHVADVAPKTRSPTKSIKYLLIQGNQSLAEGAYANAIEAYQALLELNPRNVAALNNLGAALCKLGRYGEAANRFRQAVSLSPHDADAHGNLGNVLRWTGHIGEAEIWLRRALKLKPNFLDARNNLGLTFAFLGRLREAETNFRKVLKAEPRNADALFGMGHIAKLEGRFDEAEVMFKRSLEVNPKMPSAWADLANIRKLTASDHAWLKGAEDLVASGIAPLDEAELRFAIGKYYDDVKDFKDAFRNYKSANLLLKTIAEDYVPDTRSRAVDELMRVYTREGMSRMASGASASMKPIFVVGMPRSGTSLAEQIIASHPSVKGAGELTFWNDAWREHETAILQGVLDESARKSLAEAYLRVLETHSEDAQRVVDKAPINSDHLGLIHSVFPNARIVYMQRDPIDTCLSCYFQKFAANLNFTMDLADLAHYYREHHRLMAHWRAVLPPGTILDLPYAELVANQEEWTRKILDFLGLEWDERCLEFHNTKRAVVTASYWQVRQKIYKDSVARWRNYEKSIGPLLPLRHLTP